MSAIRIPVTAAHIATAGAWPRPPAPLPSDWKNPVELALEARSGAGVDVSGDGGLNWIATIGTDRTVLVVELPDDANDALNALWNGDTMDPFEFELDFDDWFAGLALEIAEPVARAARPLLGVELTAIQGVRPDEEDACTAVVRVNQVDHQLYPCGFPRNDGVHESVDACVAARDKPCFDPAAHHAFVADEAKVPV